MTTLQHQDNTTADAVALFRYSVIADLLHLDPQQRQLSARLREKAERSYDPRWTPKTGH